MRIAFLVNLTLLVSLTILAGCRPMASMSDDEIYDSIAAHYDAGDFEEALRYAEAAVSRQPGSYEPYVERAHCYLALERIEKAMEDANHAVELGPNKHWSYQVRSDVWSAMEEHQKSIDDINRAMELQPNYFVHYTCRGYEYEMLGEYRKALDDYIRAIRLNEEDFLAWNNYASVRCMAPEEKLRDGKKALNGAKKAIKLAEDDEARAYAWDTLGSAYAELGEFDKAIEAGEKALSFAIEADKAEIQSRIELYKSGTPARIQPIASP